MKAVIAALNRIVQGEDVNAVTPGDARLALHAIETQSLAINALRLLIEQCEGMNDVGAPFYAALDHAKKLLKLHDDYVARHSTMVAHVESIEKAFIAESPLRPKPADSPAAKKPVADQDVSDLV